MQIMIVRSVLSLRNIEPVAEFINFLREQKLSLLCNTITMCSCLCIHVCVYIYIIIIIIILFIYFLVSKHFFKLLECHAE